MNTIKNKRNLTIFSLGVIIIAFAIYHFTNGKRGNFDRTYYYLDTVNTVNILNGKEKASKEALDDINSILKDIHNNMSSQLEASEVSAVNRASGESFVKVSDGTFDVIKEAVKYARLTNDTFDPAIGAVSSLWNIGTEKAAIPPTDKLNAAVKLVNYKDLVLNDSDKSVKLLKKGMKIDLGGIAKGYVADRIADLLKKKGIENAIINLGGNVYVLGDKDGNAYKVGIRNPDEGSSDTIGYVTESNCSVVTSGIYERYFKQNGKIYHHMLSPKNGYPFENNLNSVTIVSKKSIDGDALSTSTFGLGLEKGMKFIDSRKDVDAIFVTKDNKIYLTKGIKKNFVLTDDSFKIAN